jgi:hypothetical protein
VKVEINADTHLTAVMQGQFMPLIRWNNNYACVKGSNFMANWTQAFFSPFQF